MSQQPSHDIPSSQQGTERTLVGEQGATIIGVIASLVGLGLTIWALVEFFSHIGDLILLLFTAYVIALTCQFMVSRAWIGGLSTYDIRQLLAGPVSFFRVIRKRTAASASHTGQPVVREVDAKLIGGSLAIFSALLVGASLFSVHTILGITFLLAFAAWIDGAVAQFRRAESWRDGITVSEIRAAVT